MKKIILLFVSISTLLCAQEDVAENAIGNEEKRFLISSKILDNMDFKLSSGFTHYNMSDFVQSNHGHSYEFAILTHIDDNTIVASHLNIMHIQGSRSKEHAINSHNPYALYEGNGDYFKTNMHELSLVISNNLPQRLLSAIFRSLNESLFLPDKLKIYYNLGVGMCNFHSIRYNSISDSYIYGYGYDDLNYNFESRKSFWDLPKSRVLIYGFSFDYKIGNASSLYFSSSIHHVENAYVDADMAAGNGDRFLNVLVGYKSRFNFTKNKSRK